MWSPPLTIMLLPNAYYVQAPHPSTAPELPPAGRGSQQGQPSLTPPWGLWAAQGAPGRNSLSVQPPPAATDPSAVPGSHHLLPPMLAPAPGSGTGSSWEISSGMLGLQGGDAWQRAAVLMERGQNGQGAARQHATGWPVEDGWMMATRRALQVQQQQQQQMPGWPVEDGWMMATHGASEVQQQQRQQQQVPGWPVDGGNRGAVDGYGSPIPNSFSMAAQSQISFAAVLQQQLQQPTPASLSMAAQSQTPFAAVWQQHVQQQQLLYGRGDSYPDPGGGSNNGV